VSCQRLRSEAVDDLLTLIVTPALKVEQQLQADKGSRIDKD
jgi:hypothetical protein